MSGTMAEKIRKQLVEDGKEFLKKSKYTKNPNDVFIETEVRQGFNKAFLNHKLNKIYLGIGCEFLLKALFLGAGYEIHEYTLSKLPKLKDKTKGLTKTTKTISFNFMIENINKVIARLNRGEKTNLRKGLTLIKDWRNDEVHIAGNTQKYDSGEYKLALYAVQIILKNIKIQEKSKES